MIRFRIDFLVILTAILALILTTNTPASGQDCIDYSIPGNINAASGLDLPGYIPGTYCNFLKASGPYLTLHFFNEYFGASFYKENLDGEMELLFNDVSTNVSYSYQAGYGCNHIGTYRKSGVSGSSYFEHNYVIDLSTPETPTGELDHFGKTWIHGDNAFILAGDTFWIYSLADIESPVLVGSFSAPSSGTLYTLAFFDGFVAVLAPGALLETWSISNPEAPIKLASEVLPFSSYRMGKGLDYILICGGSDGLLKVDLSDPANPVIPPSGWDFGMNVNSVTVKFPYAYFVSGSFIRALNIESDPPELLPAKIYANDGSLSMGIHQIFYNVGTGKARLPLDCDNTTPIEKRTIGSFKSLFLNGPR